MLSENATWTILGSTHSAGTYTIPDLKKHILKPFNARLSGPLVPELKAIYQDGDTVIILFNGKAHTLGGSLYENSYAWFFTMNGNQVQKVTAVLDLTAFDSLMALPTSKKID